MGFEDFSTTLISVGSDAIVETLPTTSSAFNSDESSLAELRGVRKIILNGTELVADVNDCGDAVKFLDDSPADGLNRIETTKGKFLLWREGQRLGV